ncbi:hypothetical protein [Wolbachia endosymbiont (group A) of Anoplius nigerrimus]|uniref:hypothetical protein n=1 Tax=Wolbachia endosymbiont (group A) of Anoplius nigerrimus TaxID=2953979 RepID=UPI002231EDD9|nr:hypothetical protein [Wolbachia endosymbiont (group A) of Anoplius nigerrimus]
MTLAKNHLAPMVFYSFVFPFLNGLQTAVANPRKVSLRHTAAVSLDPANKQWDDEVIVIPPRTFTSPQTVIPP